MSSVSLQNNIIFYSPSALVSIINAAFVLNEAKNIIQVSGVFLKEGLVSYNSKHYDKLKDEASDSSLTVVTPDLIHNKLSNNTTIQFNGFLTKKVNKIK